MATTTPNYGWPVPTSTDLVKNGATAIEGLGDAIDASLLDLKGGTTGQVLAKATNTDMDFTWTTSSSGLSAASQAEMEAGSSTTVAVTPGRQQYHPSAAKFWIKFNGTGTPAINASYNFTSITDSGTGYYELYIATDFSSGSYCVVASSTKLSGASSDATIMMASPVGAYSAGNFGLITANLQGTLSDSDANFVVGYGDQ
jgi:hypothetical protein